MNARASLLFGLLLATPAWTQEPATFDLRSDAVRKIVRDTAASQAVPARPIETAVPVSRETGETLTYVEPVEKPPAKRETPQPAPAPSSNGFVSTLFEILAEEIFDVEEDYSYDSNRARWLTCQPQDAGELPPDLHDTCPGMNRAAAAEKP